MEPFYYTKMTRDEQAAYRALLDCLLAQRTECPVPALTRRALSDVFFRLRLDHPEIFWAVTFRYRTEPGADRITVLPEYLFDPAKVRAHRRALQSRVEKLARPMLGAPPLEQDSNSTFGNSLVRRSYRSYTPRMYRWNTSPCRSAGNATE